MDYTQLMTHNEAAVLANLLLDGGKDEKLMQVLHCDLLPSDAAKCVAHAIRVLESKDLDVDVITVFEYIRDADLCKVEYPAVQPLLTIGVLNSIVLVVGSRSEAQAIAEGFFRDAEERGDE